MRDGECLCVFLCEDMLVFHVNEGPIIEKEPSCEESDMPKIV